MSEYIWKTFYIFFSKYKKLFLIYIFFLIFTYPLEAILVPKIFSLFFKNINNNKNYSLYLIYLILLFLIISISFCIINYIEYEITPSFAEFNTNYIFKNILKLYELEYLDLELGKTNYIFTTIPNSLRELFTIISNSILPQLFSIIILIFYFFFINYLYGLYVLISFIVYIIILYYLFINLLKTSELRYKVYLTKIENTNDKFSNLFSIYSSGTINNEIEDYVNDTINYKESYKNNMMAVFKIKTFHQIYNNILCIFLIFFTISLYINKKITKDILIILLITTLYYFPCFNIIINSLTSITIYLGILGGLNNELKKLYNQHNTLKDHKKKHNIENGKIDFINLTYKYKNTKVLFYNINLKIENKKKIAFIGDSGNGKTTLFKLILGMYKLERGMLFIDNIDIKDYDINYLRKQISYVSQNNKLFNNTIYYNIQYGNNINYKEIDELCERLKILGIFKNLPDGLNTKVGISGDKLSGGQKQMINILREICTKNKIVLLDEPTTAIDVINKEYILNGIQEISKLSTVIIITHDSSLLNYVDIIYRIESGKINKVNILQNS